MRGWLLTSLVLLSSATGCGRLGFGLLGDGDGGSTADGPGADGAAGDAAAGDAATTDGAMGVAPDPIGTDLAPTDVGGVMYEVATGTTLELAAEDAIAVDSINRVAFPPAGSGFGPGPYVGLSGTTPEVRRVGAAGLEPFATSNLVDGPDRNVSILVFSDPAGPYGDFLYVCSASTGGGDGVFRVDPAGTFSRFSIWNNCNGLDFDRAGVLGDPGFASPMYVDENSDTINRVDPFGTRSQLTSSLPWGASGHKLYLNDAPPFPVGLYGVYPGDSPPMDGTGAVWRTDVADPWPMMRVEILTDLGNPNGATFTRGAPFGDLLWLAMMRDGAVVAYRPDLTPRTVVTGLVDVIDVLVDPSGGAIWIVERGRGRLLRLVPDTGGGTA